MIDVSKIDKFYLIVGSTDLRKGIDGYSTLVSGMYQLDPFSKSIFMFSNRARNKLKILYWDSNGFWLCYKRFESGTIKWLRANEEGVVSISEQQLKWLLEGLDINQKRAFKPLQNKVI